MGRVRDLLFGDSPYLGFNADCYAPDLQGWGSDHPLLTRAIERIRPSRIIEVGTWKGRSAINMAREVRRLGLDCEIVCVDTWLGSPEHWLRQQKGWYESLLIENAFPQLYRTFLANVIREGLQDIITPLPNTSDNAATILRKQGIEFDLCYLDAAHEYSPVMRDLGNYWSLLRNPGILIGDDYSVAWPEVVQAVNTFAVSQSVALRVNHDKYILAKGVWNPPVE